MLRQGHRLTTPLLTASSRILYSRSAGSLVGKDISSGSYVLTDSLGNPHTPSLFKGRKVVLVGTSNSPACANYVVPSFVKNNESIYGAGIDNIICVGATDPYTLRSWEMSWDKNNELQHLADVNTQFLRWLDLIDSEKSSLEAKPFTLIVENGIVKHENIEQSHDDFTVTDAGTILKQLGKTLPKSTHHH